MKTFVNSLTFKILYSIILVGNLISIFTSAFPWLLGNIITTIFMLSVGIFTELYTFYKEFKLFGHIYYIQIGRHAVSHNCAYLISWGQLWFDSWGECEYATLHGIFKSFKN